jgi:hypothetical protein
MKFVRSLVVMMMVVFGSMVMVGCPNETTGETRTPVPEQYQGIFGPSGEIEISAYQLKGSSSTYEIWFVEPNQVYRKNGDNDQHFGTFTDVNTFKNVLNGNTYKRKTQ